MNRCLLCGDTAITAKVDGRFVTTSCPACYAVLIIEFDPPDDPTLRARIERIDDEDLGGTNLARPITVDKFTAGPALKIVPSLQRRHAADHRLSIHERAITRRTQQLWSRRIRR
jgi:hypothetical protein